jgi:NNP family nitrate/nitrite transporter-like MFS transporter
MPLGSALISGWLADKFGNRGTIASVLLLTGISTCCIGLVDGFPLSLSIFIQPILAVCFFPAGFAMLSRLVAPSARNVIISLAIPLSFFIGAGLMPALITVLADVGLFSTGIILTGLTIFIASFLVFLIGDRAPAASRDAE